MRLRLVVSIGFSFAMVGVGLGCGAAATNAEVATETVGTARPGPPLDLIALVPQDAVVALRADLSIVRQDPSRYAWITTELANELDLASESATVRALLDRTEQAVGVFVPSASGVQEGFLVFSGRYSDADFERALAIATSRHGGSGTEERGADGRRVVRLGNAVLVQLDPWTWAIGQGPTSHAHLSQVPIGSGRAFARDLIEFGARIGLPQGSAQAWAQQDTAVGTDMVGLVFQGENPQMVHNFVQTVGRHLGL